MLKDCLEVFKNMYEKEGDKLILDSYVLAEGSYLLVKKDGTIEKLEVSKKDTDKTDMLYKDFAKLDYLSKLIDMNKPIDAKKVIHSNNYLSFFIKKENIEKDEQGKVKLTEEIIDKYYEVLANPRLKYKEKEKKSMYEECEAKYGEVDITTLNNNKEWIKKHIFNILDEQSLKRDKSYLKIFFEEDINKYSIESEKYLIPNIYNSTDFNVKINGQTYGLPNNNMGLNAKKPYLEHKGRKNTIPYLISSDEVLLQKKLFDFLMNNVAIGKRLVYIDDEIIKCYANGERPKGKFTGYFMRLQKGKEVEIHDFDSVVNMNSHIREFKVFKPIDIDYSNHTQTLNYDTTNKIEDIEMNISNVFFNKFLHTNYFTDPKDIKLNEGKIKQILIHNRESLFNWFYKGNIEGAKTNFKRYSLDIVKNTILNSNKSLRKASEQYNLRYSLLNYFYGGSTMGDILKDIKVSLREKINSKETQSIQNDEEYYFAIGQISSYLISLNKSSNKNHSLVNPILNAKKEDRLKEEIMKLFKKYNYTIKKDSKRFNNIYSMILGYKPQGEINEDLLLAGYLSSSLIYEKVEEKINE